VKRVKKELESFLENIQAQVTALEILTNLCSEELAENSVPMDDGDTLDDDSVAEPMQQDAVENGVSQQGQDLVWTLGLFPRVMRWSTVSVDANSLSLQNSDFVQTEFFENFFKFTQNVKERAIACTCNLLLDKGAKSHLQDPGNIWECLCKICVQYYSSPNLATDSLAVEILENIAHAMWTLLRLFSQTVNPILIPSADNVQGIMQFAKLPFSENLRATSVGMLGIIGQLPNFAAAVGHIAKILLEGLEDSSAVVIAEALNSIFDIFAETNLNEVVKACDLVKVLESFLPHLKNKIRNEKRMLDRMVWDRLDESRINLIRFIKYKKNQF